CFLEFSRIWELYQVYSRTFREEIYKFAAQLNGAQRHYKYQIFFLLPWVSGKLMHLCIQPEHATFPTKSTRNNTGDLVGESLLLSLPCAKQTQKYFLKKDFQKSLLKSIISGSFYHQAASSFRQSLLSGSLLVTSTLLNNWVLRMKTLRQK
ncbi:MAG: hypothetical protein AAFQ40_15925, partial [Cyanobacteria bacterium J06623_5]